MWYCLVLVLKIFEQYEHGQNFQAERADLTDLAVSFVFGTLLPISLFVDSANIPENQFLNSGDLI